MGGCHTPWSTLFTGVLLGFPLGLFLAKEILKAKPHLLHDGTSPGSAVSGGSRPITCLFRGLNVHSCAVYIIMKNSLPPPDDNISYSKHFRATLSSYSNSVPGIVVQICDPSIKGG